MYTHDGSESGYDFIVILALGHSSEASSRISITIRHEDDRQPTKSENATFSMTLREGLYLRVFDGAVRWLKVLQEHNLNAYFTYSLVFILLTLQ